jgi:hypothetical protein
MAESWLSFLLIPFLNTTLGTWGICSAFFYNGRKPVFIAGRTVFVQRRYGANQIERRGIPWNI